MMKKALPIGIALSTLLSFTGCSPSNDQANKQAKQQADAKTANDAAIDPVVLRFSHFWPASSAMHVKLFEPWANKVAEESNGNIQVEIYPSAALSKPNATYDATAKGIIDIGVQVQGYASGRFPLTQIAELPGLSNTATQLNCILQTLYDNGDISREYDDTHPLFMMGAGPGVFHTIDKPIRKPEDMAGMRIRRPSAIAGNIIEAAGGTPVGLPAPDLYTSLQRGVIDGLSFPWDATSAFRLNELVNTHTNMPLYSSAIVVTMNKDKYNSLPDELKTVIDNNSGEMMSSLAGSIFDEEDAKGEAGAKANGDTIINIPDPLSDPAWKDLLETEIQKYIDDSEKQGLAAQAVYEKAKEASVACKS